MVNLCCCCVFIPKKLSPKTNGCLVRFVGRNRIHDGYLLRTVSTLTAICCLPLCCLNLFRAKQARKSLDGRRGDICLQLTSGTCCCCGCGRKSIAEIEHEERMFAESLCDEISSRLPNGRDEYDRARKVRFVCLSDTHNQHRKLGPLPMGDVLVHTGDFTNHGTLEEVAEFANWLAQQPHRLKIVVPGNHEMIMDTPYWENGYWSDWSAEPSKSSEAYDEFSKRNIHVLLDECLDIVVGHDCEDSNEENYITKRIKLQKGGDGLGTNSASSSIRIFGSPWTTSYAEWRTAFNRTDGQMKEHWKSLPKVDVLLTHMPPFSAGDLEPYGIHSGCPHLFERIIKTRPTVHVFGHVHSDVGVGVVKESGTHWINASNVCDYYFVGKRRAAVFDAVETPKIEEKELPTKTATIIL